MPSEIRQSRKDKYLTIPLICDISMVKFTETESKIEVRVSGEKEMETCSMDIKFQLRKMKKF